MNINEKMLNQLGARYKRLSLTPQKCSHLLTPRFHHRSSVPNSTNTIDNAAQRSVVMCIYMYNTNFSSSYTTLGFLRRPLLPPFGNITFGKPLARLDQLHDVDHLLPEHYREAEACEDPWYSTVEFVRSCHLHCTCRPRIREENAGFRRRWDAWL